METMTTTSTLVAEICCACGTAFAMEESLRENRLMHKDNFYCPNGHSQVYVGEPLDKKCKRQESQLKNEKETRIWWQDEAETKARSLSATKGVLTKTKKRIANGICPSCNRQFTNLQRHMKTKHPNYVEGEQK